MNNDDCVVLDVRPILASGRDPFADIMAAVNALPPGKSLKLLNTFEPVPLYHVLGGKGFDHDTQQIGDIYEIVFSRRAGGEAAPAAPSVPPGGRVPPGLPNKIVEIDVRGLEPPEPMVKILETLNTLPPGTRLVVHHHREPALLYDKLDARGYRAKTEKIDEGHYLVTIVPK
ncbi:MAG: hypothetical protein A2V83_06900 [Nitrospirae bacterium RBG_16_64_22]|nr:MAG: hypothetical protein A2V83_06900 [Nitrospirae bacterium RBG_16_64_22]